MSKEKNLFPKKFIGANGLQVNKDRFFEAGLQIGINLPCSWRTSSGWCYPQTHHRTGVRMEGTGLWFTEGEAGAIIREEARELGWIKAAAKFSYLLQILKATQNGTGENSRHYTGDILEGLMKMSPGRANRRLWAVRRRANAILSAYTGQPRIGKWPVVRGMLKYPLSTGKAAIMAVAENLAPKGSLIPGEYSQARDLLVKNRTSSMEELPDGSGYIISPDKPDRDSFGIQVFSIREKTLYHGSIQTGERHLVRVKGTEKTYILDTNHPSDAFQYALERICKEVKERELPFSEGRIFKVLWEMRMMANATLWETWKMKPEQVSLKSLALSLCEANDQNDSAHIEAALFASIREAIAYGEKPFCPRGTSVRAYLHAMRDQGPGRAVKSILPLPLKVERRGEWSYDYNPLFSKLGMEENGGDWAYDRKPFFSKLGVNVHLARLADEDGRLQFRYVVMAEFRWNRYNKNTSRVGVTSATISPRKAIKESLSFWKRGEASHKKAYRARRLS